MANLKDFSGCNAVAKDDVSCHLSVGLRRQEQKHCSTFAIVTQFSFLGCWLIVSLLLAVAVAAPLSSSSEVEPAKCTIDIRKVTPIQLQSALTKITNSMWSVEKIFETKLWSVKNKCPEEWAYEYRMSTLNVNFPLREETDAAYTKMVEKVEREADGLSSPETAPVQSLLEPQKELRRIVFSLSIMQKLLNDHSIKLNNSILPAERSFFPTFHDLTNIISKSLFDIMGQKWVNCTIVELVKTTEGKISHNNSHFDLEFAFMMEELLVLQVVEAKFLGLLFQMNVTPKQQTKPSETNTKPKCPRKYQQ